MADKLNTLQSLLKEIEHGLYLMGPDRVRAMSVHETEDMTVALHEKVQQALKLSDDLKS